MVPTAVVTSGFPTARYSAITSGEPSHLTDRVDARLVPVGDHRALAEAIAELLHDPALAASIGAAGHRIGQTVFDVDTLVDGVEAAYAMVTS